MTWAQHCLFVDTEYIDMSCSNEFPSTILNDQWTHTTFEMTYYCSFDPKYHPRSMAPRGVFFT